MHSLWNCYPSWNIFFQAHFSRLGERDDPLSKIYRTTIHRTEGEHESMAWWFWTTRTEWGYTIYPRSVRVVHHGQRISVKHPTMIVGCFAEILSIMWELWSFPLCPKVNFISEGNGLVRKAHKRLGIRYGTISSGGVNGHGKSKTSRWVTVTQLLRSLDVHLFAFFCRTNWYFRYAVLNRAYAKSEERTTNIIKGIALHTFFWGDADHEAIADLKDMLSNPVRLSYPSTELPIYVFTDASERYLAVVVTQIKDRDSLIPFAEHIHTPLAFLVSAFEGSECSWSTFEKAIFQTIKRLDYLFMHANAIHFYTDHRNLLFVYTPPSFDATLNRYILSVSKVQCWALFLSQFSYTIEHINGDSNTFPDISYVWERVAVPKKV